MKLTLIAALALTGIATVATADDDLACGDTVFNIADQAYVVQEVADPAAQWIYLESNGVSHLQRGGIMLHGGRDWCQASTNPDLGLY